MIEQLSSASLLLTVITVLYSLWYSEIKIAKEKESKRDKRNNGPLIRQVDDVLRSKSFPLTLLSIILCLILLPDTISIILDSALKYLANPFSIIENYSSVRTTYCFIEFGLIALCIRFIFDLKKLHEKKKELRPE